MITTIPTITKNFIEDIEEKAQEGTYRVSFENLKIDVFPYVFPPQSPFSESSKTLYDGFGDLTGKKVLDIGTGTGIQAIQVALKGAEQVDAVDIFEPAVECAKHNISLNGLEKVVRVFQSDMFSNIPEEKYDLIIANLPIVDAEQEEVRLHSLFDPNFKYHIELFKEAAKYLSENGRINLCHANLQSHSFQKLESLARRYGFIHRVIKSVNSLGYEWRDYEFSKEVKGGNK